MVTTTWRSRAAPPWSAASRATPRSSSARTPPKVFRRVTPGRNPDIEIHASAHRGRRPRTSPHCTAGQQLVEGDGDDASWRCCSSSCGRRATAGSSRRPACATSSPRATCTPTRSAATSPPRRTGSAPRSAEMHDDLATRSDPATLSPRRPRRTRWSDRLEPAIVARRRAGAARRGLRRCFDALRRWTVPCPCQRVHGDLHLGPDAAHRPGLEDARLRGRAAKPLAERVAARLPAARRGRHAALVRLRARQLLGDHAGAKRRSSTPRRRAEWAERNRAAFLDGYAEAAVATSATGEPALLARRTRRTRRSTRSSTRPATGRPGCASPSRPSSV